MLVLTLSAAVPDRPDSVDHMAGRQSVALGDLGVTGLTSTEGPAFRQQFGSGRIVDRTVHATAAKQRCIGGVDDGVNAQCGDVGDDNLEPRRPELARRKAQAEAAASVTPLSANSCCNSPAWNISRMMSQPPTNSPLT